MPRAKSTEGLKQLLCGCEHTGFVVEVVANLETLWKLPVVGR
jgi:hypothetical protein